MLMKWCKKKSNQTNGIEKKTCDQELEYQNT